MSSEEPTPKSRVLQTLTKQTPSCCLSLSLPYVCVCVFPERLEDRLPHRASPPVTLGAGIVKDVAKTQQHKMEQDKAQTRKWFLSQSLCLLEDLNLALVASMASLLLLACASLSRLFPLSQLLMSR